MSKKRKLAQILNGFQQKQEAVEKRIKAIGKLNEKGKKKPTPQPVRLPSYSYKDDILLLGEANFSFTRALVKILNEKLGEDVYTMDEPGSIVATNYDSKEITLQKYPDLDEVLDSMKDLDNCTFLYEVNATNLNASLSKAFKKAGKQSPNCSLQFDKIIFNFPHTGAGIKDEAVNIKHNQEMLINFFNSCREVLKECGEVHVTLKTGKPYDLWRVKLLAKQCGLVTLRTMKFECDAYKGYEHRRTLGFQEGVSFRNNAEIKKVECKTFIFGLKEREIVNKVKKQSNSDEE